jgi:sulfur-oxidizing protein SoxY
MGHRLVRSSFAALLAVLATFGAAVADESQWPAIRETVFGDRELADGRALIDLEAPDRAHDAAVVPVTIRARSPQTPEQWVQRVWLVIDQNPAPVAGIFHLTPESSDATIATRVRVDQYTPIHAVAETSDGKLWVVERFVKAAGGCSAPAMKDAEAAMARLGQMKLRPMTAVTPGQLATAQLLVSHPNYSGLQMDQVSRNWIPPDYVRSIKITQAGRKVLEVEGDIALSEDPSITFNFMPTLPGALDVAVEDSEGRRFNRSFELGAGS